MPLNRRWAHRLKRAMDLAIAIPLLALALPVLLVAAMVIRVRSPGPALFRQPREGLGGRPFVMLKLRTMRVDAPAVLELHLAASADAREEWRTHRRLANDPRLVPGGRWLRRTSLDELPQLWNVIRGEMSLVGPRPYEPRVLDAVDPGATQLRRSVKPGLTGAWQVSGRSDLDLATLLRMDAEYVQRWSLWHDLRILGRTPGAVMSGRGAY